MYEQLSPIFNKAYHELALFAPYYAVTVPQQFGKMKHDFLGIGKGTVEIKVYFTLHCEKS